MRFWLERMRYIFYLCCRSLLKFNRTGLKYEWIRKSLISVWIEWCMPCGKLINTIANFSHYIRSAHVTSIFRATYKNWCDCEQYGAVINFHFSIHFHSRLLSMCYHNLGWSKWLPAKLENALWEVPQRIRKWTIKRAPEYVKIYPIQNGTTNTTYELFSFCCLCVWAGLSTVSHCFHLEKKYIYI